jgi:hypothetical protein
MARPVYPAGRASAQDNGRSGFQADVSNEKCEEPDGKIWHYRELASYCDDQQILAKNARLIAELEKQKLTFGCEAAKSADGGWTPVLT